MDRKIIRPVPLALGRAYYGKKYFKRFALDDFRQEMRDHVCGGPERVLPWEFRQLAKLKTACYSDAQKELGKAKRSIQEVLANLTDERAAVLESLIEKIEDSASSFVDAAVGKP